VGLSNANGHSGAQGDRLPSGGRAHACVTRLVMLIALLLSAAHVEARAGLYAKALMQRGIPSVAAVNSQTITFPAISNKTYGVALFTVNVTASSGLGVTRASLTSSSLLVMATLCRWRRP
jgi:hypothetical protein